MSDRHDHIHAPHATADAPTLSLLRLSAWQRLAGAGVVLAVLWLAVIAIVGEAGWG
jgi:hypothetical protein